MRKGGYRSSRLFYPMIANLPMTKNPMYYKVVNGKYVEVEEGEEYTFSIEAQASNYTEEFEPYRAFRQMSNSYGWRCAEGFVEGAWIQVNLPYWYKRPGNPNPTRSGSNPPAVSAVEIWTPSSADLIPKKFKILGSYDGSSWDVIRDCEIKKPIINKMFAFTLTYGDEDNPTNIDNYPRYLYFRIEITEGYGEQFVQIDRIDFRAHVDHNEPVFGGDTYAPWGGIAEKLFMDNEYCDGLIWEKIHSKDIIFSAVDWYPGFYSSRSYTVTMFHPHDPLRFYKSRTHGAFGKDTIQRTKDFLISVSGSYYYMYYGTVAVSNDGIHWTKDQRQDKAYSWLNNGYSWSTKRNVGIMGGYRLEITDEGQFKAIQIPSAAGPAVGDIMANGSTGPDSSAVIQYMKFLNADGDEYVSALQSNFSYIDQSQPEGKQVIWTGCNWNYAYLNGKYFAFGVHPDIRYWNEVRREWQTLSHFTIIESSDGFKHITPHSIADPVIGNSFSEYCLYYFNDKYYIFEKGSIRDPSTDQWVNHARVWNFGNSYGNNPTVKDALDYITVPLIGYNADPLYDTVTMVFKGDGPSLNRNKNIGGSFSSPFGRTVYVKDGKPSEPYGHLIWRTTFKINWWGSGACDEGGYVFIEGDLTSKPGKNSLACGTSNIIIDRDDDTWGPRGK